MRVLEPKDRSFFHVEWETTMKCNLDCKYCSGHDNSLEHPSLEDSLKTVDFIFEYVNEYMKLYPHDNPYVMRHVNIDLHGGETMFHPNIVEILEYAREKRNYYTDFNANVSTITNAVVGKRAWKKISSLIDYFTVSYHAESLPKQQQMMKENILHLKEIGKNFHVSVMMHPHYWENCVEMTKWCEENSIPYNPRQIDRSWLMWNWNYSKEQAAYLSGNNCGCGDSTSVFNKLKETIKGGIDMSAQGRTCCGGVPFFVDENYEETHKFVNNKFKGWQCSVNRFFLFIRQTTGEVFTNKDCRHNLDSKVAPLGYLGDTNSIIDELKNYTSKGEVPTITCQKRSCWCGMCAPKAADKNSFDRIIKKYTL